MPLHHLPQSKNKGRKKEMKISQVVELPEGTIQFTGELGEAETNLVVEIGLNYLIRAGAFPQVAAALEKAAKEEEAQQGYAEGYEFPTDMDKND